MDLQELYDWAFKNGVLFSDLIVKDSNGHDTKNIKPIIITHHHENGDEYELKLCGLNYKDTK